MSVVGLVINTKRTPTPGYVYLMYISTRYAVPNLEKYDVLAKIQMWEVRQKYEISRKKSIFINLDL